MVYDIIRLALSLFVSNESGRLVLVLPGACFESEDSSLTLFIISTNKASGVHNFSLSTLAPASSNKFYRIVEEQRIEKEDENGRVPELSGVKSAQSPSPRFSPSTPSTHRRVRINIR